MYSSRDRTLKLAALRRDMTTITSYSSQSWFEVLKHFKFYLLVDCFFSSVWIKRIGINKIRYLQLWNNDNGGFHRKVTNWWKVCLECASKGMGKWIMANNNIRGYRCKSDTPRGWKFLPWNELFFIHFGVGLKVLLDSHEERIKIGDVSKLLKKIRYGLVGEYGFTNHNRSSNKYLSG